MFSLVIPIYNEELLLDRLVERVTSAVESFTNDYEIIFVDDGSSDGSLSIILKHRELNDKIKCVELSRNYGHQIAFTAGLDHASGDVVGMMDGDLQDPPELLPEMFKKITDEGFDIVSGKKIGRRGNAAMRLNVWMFHKIFKNISGIKGMENYGNFSMMRRVAVDALLSIKEKIRYLPGLRTYIGFKQGFVEFVRDDRLAGAPKMTFGKLLNLAFDAIFSFSRFPMKLCVFLGCIGAITSLAAIIILLVSEGMVGLSSFLITICFIGFILMISVGIIVEYVYRNYKESQGRPSYFVKEKFGNMKRQ